ncbi:MAG: MFS transporter [Gammaproteobacteria bacterium]|nr:MFS transporter [Gammaproteobacteria bacterium]
MPTVDRENALYALVTRRLIPFLFVCYVAAYLDRVNVGFAKLQMSADLKFSETIYGLGAGIFFIGYFLFEVPSNVLLHRIGARKTLTRIMLSWGLLSTAMMLVKTPEQFYLVRFLLGAAEAGFFPGVILYLTYWYPAARRGRITALFVTAVAISGVVGSPLSGFILQQLSGSHGLAGWQWLFLIEGLPTVVLGMLAYFYLDDDVASARFLTADEKEILSANIRAENQHKTSHSVWDGMKDRRVWWCCLVYFSFVCGLYGVGFWLPTIIKSMGITKPMDIGFVSAIPYGAAAVSMVLVGASADRRHERRWHIVVPAILGGLGLAASVLFSGNQVLAIAALTVGTAGLLAAIPQCWALPTSFLTGGAAASGIAIINSFGNLSGFVSPYMMGWIKDATHSTNLGMYVLAAFMFVGSFIVAFVLPTPARQLPPTDADDLTTF